MKGDDDNFAPLSDWWSPKYKFHPLRGFSLNHIHFLFLRSNLSRSRKNARHVTNRSRLHRGCIIQRPFLPFVSSPFPGRYFHNTFHILAFTNFSPNEVDSCHFGPFFHRAHFCYTVPTIHSSLISQQYLVLFYHFFLQQIHCGSGGREAIYHWICIDMGLTILYLRDLCFIIYVNKWISTMRHLTSINVATFVMIWLT